MEMSAGCILMIDADVIKALSGCIEMTGKCILLVCFVAVGAANFIVPLRCLTTNHPFPAPFAGAINFYTLHFQVHQHTEEKFPAL